MSAKWIRVTRADRCSICGKPDFCAYCSELRLVLCMRSESSRPSRGAMGGWIHALGNAPRPVHREPEPIRETIDAGAMAREWHAQTRLSEFERLADLLGVSAQSLLAMRCGYAPEHRAWSFPMRNGAGAIVGIRLRNESGKKWSVTGGHEGVFLPQVETRATCWVCEGATDCAALLTLGKMGIGRPSCSGGLAALSATVARLGIREAVIIADNDPDKFLPSGKRWNPGLDGAKRLAADIGVKCCIVVLPCKDLREFVTFGGTRELLDSFVSGVVWHVPK